MRLSSRQIVIGLSACSLLIAPWLFLSSSRAHSPEHLPARPTSSTRVAQASGIAGPESAVPAQGKSQGGKKPDVIFVPTPQMVVDRMLELAEVKKGDVLYDLGCGDGRIVVTAAKKYGVKAIGFDVDPQRISEARANVKENGVEDLVTIRQADIFETDLKAASVVTLYLLPELNVRLMPQLEQLGRGARIVSHDFDMKGAKPGKVVTLQDDQGEEEHSIYLWVVPWEKENP
jgi:protein-L-isoaspartate O-methyltransferase